MRTPVPREECEKFKENGERIKQKFWKKWEGKVYTAFGKYIDEVDFKSEKDVVTEQSEKSITENTEVNFESVDEVSKEENVTCGAIDKKLKTKEENTCRSTTRVFILKALTAGVRHLGEIAVYAGVDPSTAHYHLRNLIREERVIKTSWGEYVLPGQFKNDGRNCENLLKNLSQLVPGVESGGGLHPLEKNILMDILSRENKYEQYSERELARKCNLSRYAVKKYTRELEKKRLIEIKREGNRLVFVPTKIAIQGLTEFFASIKNGSKFDSSSSKFQPISQPSNSKIQPVEEFEDEGGTADSKIQPGELEMFDDFFTWQQKNAHRIILQFKVLRCDHSRLKRTGWIFGKKAIRKHFPEAYIFKSKDPSGEIVNVLPKEPFIFVSPFEFQDQIVRFVNEIVERLKDCGIYLDLSEPAEVKMEHVALEDDVFARSVVKKGLLYFRSAVKTVDSTGETMEYVIGIDKSKVLHLEFEGPEAQHLAEEYEAFIDDVVSKKIDRKVLRELPEENEKIKRGITVIQGIQDQFREDLEYFSETTKFYSENIKTHVKAIETLSQNIEQSTRTDSQIERSAAGIERAAVNLIHATELLQEMLQKIEMLQFPGLQVPLVLFSLSFS